MKTTPNRKLPYPEPGDHTRTWEYWQGLAEKLDQWGGPRAKLRTADSVDIPNARLFDMEFDTAEYDYGGIWSGSGAKMQAPVAGLYLITAFVRFSVPASAAVDNTRYIAINTDTGALAQNSDTPGKNRVENRRTIATETELNKAEAVRVVLYQSQGETLTFSGHATIRLVAPLVGSAPATKRGWPGDAE